MSQITDVLVCIDTTTIVKTYGKNNAIAAPPLIAPNHIYMIVNQGNAVIGQAGGELNIAAVVGDAIRWRECSLSLGFEQTCIFYKFVGTGVNQLISDPTPHQAQVTIPVPNPQNPIQPNKQNVSNFYWGCDTLATGSVVYHFQFMILDRGGNILGCYQWDPFITIRNN